MTQASFFSDPFKDIPPSLLNSADLRAYSEAERIFSPFDPSGLKSASYEIPFRGTVYRWDNIRNPTRQESFVDSGDTLEIPSNSIVFVSPSVKIKVPEYLALRFNLCISLVHRGLLLGTGPLVDPGFEGELLIPVHNLTDAPLFVKGEDGFIWIEVTKISPHPPESLSHLFPYKPFPDKKKNMKPGAYFERANKGAPIRSSIPPIASDAKAFSDRIEKEWQDTKRVLEKKVRRLEVAAILSALLAILGFVFIYFQLAESTKQLVVSAQALILTTQQMVKDATVVQQQAKDNVQAIPSKPTVANREANVIGSEIRK